MKLLAGLAVVIGVAAAFDGIVGGLVMGGAILHGDLRRDAFSLAFIILPLIAACLFVFGIRLEAARPAAATAIYSNAVMLIGIELILPALF